MFPRRGPAFFFWFRWHCHRPEPSPVFGPGLRRAPVLIKPQKKFKKQTPDSSVNNFARPPNVRPFFRPANTIRPEYLQPALFRPVGPITPRPEPPGQTSQSRPASEHAASTTRKRGERPAEPIPADHEKAGPDNWTIHWFHEERRRRTAFTRPPSTNLLDRPLLRDDPRAQRRRKDRARMMPAFDTTGESATLRLRLGASLRTKTLRTPTPSSGRSVTRSPLHQAPGGNKFLACPGTDLAQSYKTPARPWAGNVPRRFQNQIRHVFGDGTTPRQKLTGPS